MAARIGNPTPSPSSRRAFRMRRTIPSSRVRSCGRARSTARRSATASPPHDGPPSAERGAADDLNRPQLPGDIVGDAPEIADIGLPDERIGAALIAPIEYADILPPFDRRR